ncbi:MAG: flagellin lysine-N-methylase [Oscillospiraceae bacterium]|nr:flagellin lysine-N-methylase [Oscillospiraceae bacterium]
MRIVKPSYFDQFKCIAAACPDSCCKEWTVQVDADSAAYYRTLPGALGDRLRQVLVDEDDNTVMFNENGRCPMWRQDGLCRIQAELGHDALCKTCRDFPRLTHDYGNFIEMGLELSCPEAARIILTAPAGAPIDEYADGGEEPEYDTDAMDVLLRTREEMLNLLADDSRPLGETLALGLMYGHHAQALLDGVDVASFDPDSALETAYKFGKITDDDLPAFYAELEILTESWRHRLASPAPANWSAPIRALARYGVERYWLQAVSDYDLICRVKMVITACLLVKILGGYPVETAQLYSKEIENNADNVDAILEAAYTHPVFTDENLLGMLLK